MSGFIGKTMVVRGCGLWGSSGLLSARRLLDARGRRTMRGDVSTTDAADSATLSLAAPFLRDGRHGKHYENKHDLLHE
jgi:hypothetical protein